MKKKKTKKKKKGEKVKKKNDEVRSCLSSLKMEGLARIDVLAQESQSPVSVHVPVSNKEIPITSKREHSVSHSRVGVFTG